MNPQLTSVDINHNTLEEAFALTASQNTSLQTNCKSHGDYSYHG